MKHKTSIVITSIAAPNGVLKNIAEACLVRGLHFYVIGDERSPEDFSLDGCDFYSLGRQAHSGLRFAGICPTRHYARKNIGYLLAIREGAETIIETDDDNYPLPAFWQERKRRRSVPVVERPGWLNAYAYFSDEKIWPRGLPLDAVLSPVPPMATLGSRQIDAPIQQGLADGNPDVDAIYRLILPLPLDFKRGIEVGLAPGVWCPFNSQNTTWWPEAYALMYLPAYCSFRMTDIWRSFVAQRIAWENGWTMLFESSTVRQERNDHSLMLDFKDEIPGYLHNRAICDRLGALTLKLGPANISDNLLTCYEELVRASFIEKTELPLVDAWLLDLQDAGLGASEHRSLELSVPI